MRREALSYCDIATFTKGTKKVFQNLSLPVNGKDFTILQVEIKEDEECSIFKRIKDR